MPETLPPEDASLSESLTELLREAGLAGTFDVGEEGCRSVSLAVVEMRRAHTALGGVRADDLLYPASVYKMYVAAEVLRQVREGRHSLDAAWVVAAHNARDLRPEVPSDPRPVLRAGEAHSLAHLLDLMITRSDNTAANCLIDVVGRPAIDALLRRYGWGASTVTRKFLPRDAEDAGYADVPGTVTCARHAAGFLHLCATGRLVDEWVSGRLMDLLGRQLDRTKLAAGLPESARFHHKTGWWSCYTHDVGVVIDGPVRYVIACLTPLPEDEAVPRLRHLAGATHRLMTARAGR